MLEREARALVEAGEYQQAIGLLTPIVDPSLPGHAALLEILAVAYSRLQRWSEAAEVAASLARHRPTSPLAHSNYGTTLRKIGRFAEARTAQERALGLEPGFVRAVAELKKITRDAGASGPAFDDAVVDSTPEDRAVQWRFERAMSAVQAGDWRTATDQLRPLLEREPDRHEWRAWFAHALEIGGFHDTALQHWAYLAQVAPTDETIARFAACNSL